MMKPRLCPSPRLLSLGLLALAGCVSRPPGEAARTRPVAAPVSEMSPAQRAEAYARYASGYSLEMNGQSGGAFQEYLKSVQADPGNDALAIEVARHLLQNRKPQQAADLLARSAALPGADGLIYAWMARARLALGQTNEAAAAGREAVKRSPDELDGYECLFQLYTVEERPAEALAVLNRAESVKDTDGPFLLGLAEAYERWLKNSPAAGALIKPKILAILKRAAVRPFDDPVQRQRLADQLLARGERDLAATLYLELLEDFDESPALRDSIREKLAAIYLNASDHKRATQQLEAIVRDNPTRYPQAYFYLGRMAYEDKDYEKAVGYYSKLIVIDPDAQEAYYDLAGLKITLDQPAQALQILGQARARFPGSFLVEFFSGLASAKAKDYPRAVRSFNDAEVIAAASEPARLTADFYFQFGAACERNKQYEDAEKNFLKAIKLEPDFAEALNYLGYMWADRDEKLGRAREMIEKAVKLQPKNGAYLDSLGWVLFRLKDYPGALKNELLAVENNGEPDASLYDHLGDIYFAMKSPEKAVEAWRKSVKIESSEDVKKKIQGLSSAARP